MRNLLILGCGVLATVAIGCSDDGGGLADPVLDDLPPATLTADPALAKYWAGASAPNAFGAGQAPVAAADTVLQLNEGSTCPVKVENGSTTTYEGGCTDSAGNSWFGKATVTQGLTSATIRYDGFGNEDEHTCNSQMVKTKSLYDGTLTYGGSSTGITFTLDLVIAGTDYDETTCATHERSGAVSYHGKMVETGADTDGDGDPDDQVWSGSGQYGDAIKGVATVKTDGEKLNSDTCGDEALEGSTTIDADGHTIVITYDGATDCEETSTAQWSFDGAAQGEIEGVSCSTGGAGGIGLVAFALVFVRRRRRA